MTIQVLHQPILASVNAITSQGGGDEKDMAIEIEPMSWDRATEIIVNKLTGWGESAVSLLPNIVIALVVVALFFVIGSLARKALDKVLNQVFDSAAISRLAATICSWIIIIVGFFIAFDLLGLQKAVLSLLAGAGIIGLAIGFAFQDLAENLIAGFLLGVRKPFTPGDLIQSQQQMGFVKQLNLRNTVISDFSGQIIHIPNKEVFKNVLENYSISGKRRVDISVGVSYGENLDDVTSTLIKAIESLDFLHPDEEVSAYALEFGDSSINFTVRYWIRYPDGEAGYYEAIDRGIKAIKSAFDDADILIPFPIKTLDFGIKAGTSLKESIASFESKSDSH